VTDVLNVGDELEVKLIKKDEEGRYNLSRKALMPGYDAEKEAARDAERAKERGQARRRPGSRRPPSRTPALIPIPRPGKAPGSLERRPIDHTVDSSMQVRKKVILIILDGFGLGTDPAVRRDRPGTEALHRFFICDLPLDKDQRLKRGRRSALRSDGKLRSRPYEHRRRQVVYQEITKISLSIRMGDFFEKSRLSSAPLKTSNGRDRRFICWACSPTGECTATSLTCTRFWSSPAGMGLAGSVSTLFLMGGIRLPKRVFNTSARLLEKLKGVGEIATIMVAVLRNGSRQPMGADGKGLQGDDRRDWNRATDPVAAVEDSYRRGVTDEFVLPIVLEKAGQPLA